MTVYQLGHHALMFRGRFVGSTRDVAEAVLFVAGVPR